MKPWLALLLVGCASRIAPPPDDPEPARAAAMAPAPATIHRSEVVQTVERGLGALLARADVAPVMRGGAFAGFSIRGAAPELARVGLVPGDVLVAAGGKPIRTPDDAQAAFEALRTAPAVVLEVERGGEKKTLTTPIAP